MVDMGNGTLFYIIRHDDFPGDANGPRPSNTEYDGNLWAIIIFTLGAYAQRSTL